MSDINKLLGDAARAEGLRYGGGRRAGKTVNLTVGVDISRPGAEQTVVSMRKGPHHLGTIVFDSGEPVNAETLRAKLTALRDGPAISQANVEKAIERIDIEREAERQGHHVVEGTVLGRSFEKE